MALNNTRKLINQLAGFLMLVAIATLVYHLVSADSRMQQLCAQIPLGSGHDELSRFATQHGLTPPNRHQEVSLLVERSSFGRAGCRITFSDNKVQAVEYQLAD